MRSLLVLFSVFLALTSVAQLDFNNVEKNKAYSLRFTDSILDPTYGITFYDKFNKLIDDSVRYCGKNPCYGIVQDYYPNDTLLHYGNYSEGMLKAYRNYYPTGVLEREIKFVNVYSAKMKQFYPSGILKSEIHYNESNPITWIDYYENGNKEFEEYYNKRYTRLKEKRFYYQNGQIQEEQTLIKKGKLIYLFKQYYENGTLKTEGEMRYMKNLGDYRKLGTWKHYKADGSLDKEEKFTY